MHKLVLIILVLVFFACGQSGDEGGGTGFRLEMINVPSKEGGEPNLFVSESGDVLLSWVEYTNDTTDALLFSRLTGGSWSQPITIAGGSDWFVNWADFPSLAVYRDQPGHLAAHWLQKSDHGTYDYDVRIAQSTDGGRSWSPAFVPHTDGVAAEHGFVTLLPLNNGNMLAVWLDGRNTKSGENHENSHDHGGAMTLRSAEFDVAGQLYREAELDDRVCDCCQTDAALTPLGPVVVYRDRSETEVRDISLLRYVNGAWTAPQKLFPDNWKIAGCPVNGPAIAARGEAVAVAWFTAAEDKPQVKIAFSNDAGATFGKPVRVDDGQPLGRVDVVWADAGTALVSWLEEVEDGGEIRLAKVNAGGKIGESITVAATASSRDSGFPILEKLGEDYLLAWTEADTVTVVKAALLSLD